MTNEELLSVAEIVERLVTRFHKQAADHETKMAEHRASFGARTEADAKLIAGLREERNGLLTQVQDMREEIIRVNDAHCPCCARCGAAARHLWRPARCAIRMGG